MSEDMEKIIERIRKCLELSKCAGESEAAAAMLAARRLMDKYGITEQAVEIAAIGESRAQGNVKRKPALWESFLAEVVGKAFGCRSFFAPNEFAFSLFQRKGDRVFIGEKASAEIASYAFAVLLRRVKAARKEFVRKLIVCGGRPESRRELKIRRGDLFCYAWVEAVEEKVAAFATLPEGNAAIDAFIKQRYEVSEAKEPKNRMAGELNFGDVQALHAGAAAGKDVTLQHGVKGRVEEQRLLA